MCKFFELRFKGADSSFFTLKVAEKLAQNRSYLTYQGNLQQMKHEPST